MKEESYIILSDQSSHGLAEQVNAKMAEGYAPIGGTSTPPVPKFHTSYIKQAMVKVRSSEDQQRIEALEAAIREHKDYYRGSYYSDGASPAKPDEELWSILEDKQQ